MNEVWKPVVGFEGFYEVSDLGRIRSLTRYTMKSNGIQQINRGRLIADRADKNGYRIATLCKNTSVSTVKVHRVVAAAFIPNPDGKEQVNHIDLRKDNNRVSNLEWLNCRENIRHAIGNGRWSSGGNKAVLAMIGDEIAHSFVSIKHAEREGFNRGSIHKVLIGQWAHHRGFTWRYAK